MIKAAKYLKVQLTETTEVLAKVSWRKCFHRKSVEMTEKFGKKIRPEKQMKNVSALMWAL